MTQTATTQLCPNPKCGADNPIDAIECPKCQTPQRQLLGRGMVLQGRYRIEAVRGCGGFGAVYRATDLQTQLAVAIKENHQHRTFQRFEREAKLLMRLNHPNLPKVHKVFQDAATGRAYLVMDFVSGETLEEFVQRKGALGWQEAEPLFAQVVNALTYLHSQNIIHRDIKPSNIIVTTRAETVYDEVDDWEEVDEWQEVDSWEEVVAPPPSLDERVIRNETDERRFERGRRLWQQGYLTDLQRDGRLLSGVCRSERVKGKSYRVFVELQPGRIGNGISDDEFLKLELYPGRIGYRSCECADFYGRRLCKHLVALLLAWVYEPKAFKVVTQKREKLHVFLVDFGVAKVMEAVDIKRPRSSSIIAWTDGYSPPEQYRGEVDARTDQYALAATIVFALTGQTPPDAFTRLEKYSKGEPDLPPKPSDVPDYVWKAIQKAMQFDSQQRFESVDTFWKALQSPLPLYPPEVRESGTSVRAHVGAIAGANEDAILGAILGAIKGAILGALIGSAILGTVFAIAGAIEDAILFAICGAGLGAIYGAIWGASEGARR